MPNDPHKTISKSEGPSEYENVSKSFYDNNMADVRLHVAGISSSVGGDCQSRQMYSEAELKSASSWTRTC